MTSNNTMNTTQTTSHISYSSVVNTFKQPTKDEAIVLSSIEGTKVQEYIIAVGSIVGPRNVSFASRIANNRICIYLSSKNMLDSLLHSHKYVNIKETQVEIRRLITPAQRLIISNAGPSVPTTLIEQELPLISTSNDHPASSQNILDQIPDVQVSNNQLESTIETDDMSRPTNNTNETNTLKNNNIINFQQDQQSYSIRNNTT
uniref:Uncharacterized protein LOC114344258 n=1 Tax=Diabrotica virgifera virgifera TaxID=50390 RepID=A0A6P7GMN6_DIAVI